uniref:Uncharacterized protein n=1 Tax=Arundo donax TaxID=35708 RepID=A0A0A9H871_ARUDO
MCISIYECETIIRTFKMRLIEKVHSMNQDSYISLPIGCFMNNDLYPFTKHLSYISLPLWHQAPKRENNMSSI